MTEHWFIS